MSYIKLLNNNKLCHCEPRLAVGQGPKGARQSICSMMNKDCSPRGEAVGFVAIAPCPAARRARNNTQKGFTLVEMIVMIVVLGIIAGVGVASLLNAANALSFLTVRVEMAESATVALSRMSRDIRRIDEDADITTAATAQLIFIDTDGTTITYSLNGTNLVRTSDGTANILASNVSALSLTYYNAANVAIPTPSLGAYTNIRTINVSLTFSQGPYTGNYQIKIRPRNLKHVAYKIS